MILWFVDVLLAIFWILDGTKKTRTAIWSRVVLVARPDLWFEVHSWKKGWPVFLVNVVSRAHPWLLWWGGDGGVMVFPYNIISYCLIHNILSIYFLYFPRYWASMVYICVCLVFVLFVFAIFVTYSIYVIYS